MRGEMTTGEIRYALLAALKAKDMSRAAAMIVMLAVRAPHEAEVIEAVLAASSTPTGDGKT